MEFAILFILASATAFFADKRGRNPAGWFFVGLISGVIGLIILFCLPDKKIN